MGEGPPLEQPATAVGGPAPAPIAEALVMVTSLEWYLGAAARHQLNYRHPPL
ncbi:UNVERIFIED_CONTAM: hypothetical protein Sradi_1992800 [Sesamum radiatum]|uniref:Uncharacterized protein n=1 Tax=Sesamum radiatum TaxID=300843 RepID=A0AAW2TFE9_SESRA